MSSLSVSPPSSQSSPQSQPLSQSQPRSQLSPLPPPLLPPPYPLSSRIIAELKRSLVLALPLIASEVTYAFSSFSATAMVAHLGKEELAANALVWSIYLTSVLFFIGVFNAVSIMVAQSFGARDDLAISRSFKQGLIMAVAFTIPMMLIMWFSPIILVWTGQDSAVVKVARPFFYALTWSMLPLNVIIVINQLLIGINKSRMVMLMSVIAVPIEVLFYYLFLFGKFGFPKVGLAGIGYALLFSYVLINIYFLYYLYASKAIRAYRLFEKWWHFDGKFFFELLRVGVPIGIMICAEVALFAVVALMMGVLGTTTLAAYQIAYQYFMIALMVLFGLTQNATVRVGSEVGRNDRPALQFAALINIALGFVFMLLFSVFYIFFPRIAIGVDVNVHAAHLQEMVREAEKFLAVVGVLLFIESLRIITLGALRGLKDTKFPLIASFIGFWCIAFPVAYFLTFKFNFGGIGIWWGLCVGLFIAGVILVIRFYRLAKSVDLQSLVTKN